MTLAYILSNVLLLLYMVYNAAARILDKSVDQRFAAWVVFTLAIILTENVFICLQRNNTYILVRIFLFILMGFESNQDLIIQVIERYFDPIRRFLTDKDYQNQTIQRFSGDFKLGVLKKLPDTSDNEATLTDSRLKFTNANREEHFEVEHPIIEKVDNKPLIPEAEEPGIPKITGNCFKEPEKEISDQKIALPATQNDEKELLPTVIQQPDEPLSRSSKSPDKVKTPKQRLREE